MRVLLDACSFINLLHGNLIPVLSRLKNLKLYMGPQVRDECIDYKDVIDNLHSVEIINEADDSNVPASEFLNLTAQYNLGAGETECIVLANHEDYTISCDDKKARNVAKQTLGNDRVIGTIGLIMMLVQEQFLTPEAAFESYRIMKDKGGFLPNLIKTYFNITPGH